MGLVYPLNKPLTQWVPHPIPTQVHPTDRDERYTSTAQPAVGQPFNWSHGKKKVWKIERLALDMKYDSYIRI